MVIYYEHLTYLNNVNTYLQLVTNKMFLTQTAKSLLKPESTKIILKCFLNHTVKQFFTTKQHLLICLFTELNVK